MRTCVGTLGVQPWVIHVVSSIACVYVPLGANKQIDLSAVSGKGRHMSLGGDRVGSI